MNDDFLHDHRKTPSPDFASKLRQRLHEEDTDMTAQAAVGTHNGASEAQNHHRTNGRPASQDGFQVPLTHTSSAAARERGRGTVLTLALALAAMLALISLVIIGRTPPAGDPAQASLPPLLPITIENAAQVREIASMGKGNLHQVAYSPDGSLLALAGTRGVWLHTTADLTAPARLLEGADMDFIKRVLAWSPDGSLLAMSNGDSVRVWNPVSGAVVADLDYEAQVAALAFSPDGTQLLVGGGAWDAPIDQHHHVLSWDTSTWQPGDRLLMMAGRVSALEFTPDGRYVLVVLQTVLIRTSTATTRNSAEQSTLLVFRAADQGFARKVDAPGLDPIVVSPDGEIVYGYESNRIVGWDVDTGEQVIQSPTLPSPAYDVSLAINPIGTEIAIASINTGLRLWSLAEDTLNVRAVETQGRLNYTTSVAYSPDGSQLATIEYAGLMQIWDAQTGEEVAAIRDYAGSISAVKLTPDQQQVFVADQTGTLRFYDVNSGEELRRFQTDSILYRDMADISADGSQLAYTSLNMRMQADDQSVDISGVPIIASSTGEIQIMLDAPRSLWGMMRFSPDGRWLLLSGSNGTHLWDLTQSNEITDQPLTAFTRTSTSIGGIFSPDSQFLAFSDLAPQGGRGQLVIYNVVNTQQIYVGDFPEMEGNTGANTDLAWSPDGSTIVVLLNVPTQDPRYRIQLFDIETQRFTISKSADDYLFDAAYSPDGSMLAVSVNGRVTLYDAVTLEQLAEMPPKQAAYLVEFSADGSMLLTGGWDGIVRVWGVTE